MEQRMLGRTSNSTNYYGQTDVMDSNPSALQSAGRLMHCTWKTSVHRQAHEAIIVSDLQEHMNFAVMALLI